MPGPLLEEVDQAVLGRRCASVKQVGDCATGLPGIPQRGKGDQAHGGLNAGPALGALGTWVPLSIHHSTDVY